MEHPTLKKIVIVH